MLITPFTDGEIEAQKGNSLQGMIGLCSWEQQGQDLGPGVSLYDGESNLPRILAGLLATCRVRSPAKAQLQGRG